MSKKRRKYKKALKQKIYPLSFKLLENFMKFNPVTNKNIKQNKKQPLKFNLILEALLPENIYISIKS